MLSLNVTVRLALIATFTELSAGEKPVTRGGVGNE